MESVISQLETVDSRMERYDAISRKLWWFAVFHALLVVCVAVVMLRRSLLSVTVLQRNYLLLSLVVLAPPLCTFGLRSWLRVLVRRAKISKGNLHKERVRILTAIKDDLPMKQSLPLLRKFDPSGNHKMILDSPVQAAKINTLSTDRRQLVKAIDVLLDCCVLPDENLGQIRRLLDPFKDELKNFHAFAGTSTDQRILDLLTGPTSTPRAPTKPGMPPRTAPAVRHRSALGGSGGAGSGVGAGPGSARRPSTGSGEGGGSELGIAATPARRAVKSSLSGSQYETPQAEGRRTPSPTNSMGSTGSGGGATEDTEAKDGKQSNDDRPSTPDANPKDGGGSESDSEGDAATPSESTITDGTGGKAGSARRRRRLALE